MDDGHTRVKMDEVDRHVDNTWFSWIGGAQPDSTFYYRVQSPVILIEFDHQRPVGLAKFAADRSLPTQRTFIVSCERPTGMITGRIC